MTALSGADGAVVADVADPEKVDESERLDTAKLVEAVKAGGVEAYVGHSADAIVDRLRPLVHEGDVVAVFSNGGFDGIHGKLLTKL